MSIKIRNVNFSSNKTSFVKKKKRSLWMNLMYFDSRNLLKIWQKNILTAKKTWGPADSNKESEETLSRRNKTFMLFFILDGVSIINTIYHYTFNFLESRGKVMSQTVCRAEMERSCGWVGTNLHCERFSPRRPGWCRRPSRRCCVPSPAWWRRQPAPGEHEPARHDIPETHLRGRGRERCQWKRRHVN